MKRISLLLTILMMTMGVFAQEISMPAVTDFNGINNPFALSAVIVSGLLPFILILIKIIKDDKKTKNLTEYITIHDKQHQLDNNRIDNIEESVKKLTEISLNTSKMIVNQNKIIQGMRKKSKCNDNK